jgi:hypothetical protein
MAGPNLDKLTQEVTDTTGVEDSVLVFIDGVEQKLRDAIAAQDPQALSDLADALAAKRTAVAAAIAANP